VITPYEGQRAFVVSLMARVGPLKQQLYKDIEVRAHFYRIQGSCFIWAVIF
jgi:hypothetical protein